VFARTMKTGFTLDVVRSEGPPVIYATRRGEPRLAVIGNRTALEMPIAFSAMNGRLTISSDAANRVVTIFYRPPMPANAARNREQADRLAPIQVLSKPDIVE